MHRHAAAVAAAFLLLAPLAAQNAGDDAAVHATLRLSGDRTSFKSGEPIRLDLILTADRPGFVVDTAGLDEASDVLRVDPEGGVRRFQARTGRDFSYNAPLSATPTVLVLTLNYWARFDRPGLYTVSVQSRRASRRDAAQRGWPARGSNLPVTTNPVTFQIEPTSGGDEQVLIGDAVRNLQSVVSAPPGTQALADQIRAAEGLAFLPGNAAAREKYRLYQEIGLRPSVPGNVRSILHRGFFMSRNPAVILEQVEADLLDPGFDISFGTIATAAALAVAVKHPRTTEIAGPPIPGPDGTFSDPWSLERARYLDIVHDSLHYRQGLSRLRAAKAMLTTMVNQTPPDVVRLIVAGFEQFPPDERVWLARGRWDVIRNESLGPALLRTLAEVIPNNRSDLLPALIDVAPELAVEPLIEDILDPTRIIGADIVATMPRPALGRAVRPLLRVIQEMAAVPLAENAFSLDQKIELLGVIADGSVKGEVLALYDSRAWPPYSEARQSLLRYLLEWDPDAGVQRTKESLHSDDASSILSRLGSSGPLPALNSVLRDRLADRDTAVAAEAARMLSTSGGADDRAAIELRLLRWRLGRQQRLANGEPSTDADDQFESQMVRALANAESWNLSAADREHLLGSCLTNACRVALAGGWQPGGTEQ